MQFEAGVLHLKVTREWLKQGYTRDQLGHAHKMENVPHDIFNESLLHLILQASQFSDSTVPETLRMDKTRLITFFNDWQDITILSSILAVYKGVAGPKCTPQVLEKVKSELWVLLNDTDTTMSHITLHMGQSAGQVRGAPFSTQEQTQLATMTDKTLAPESKVYELMQKRVLLHLLSILCHNSVDKVLLNKHGLLQLENELTLLGQKLTKVCQLNKAVFGKLYTLLLEDIKTENQTGKKATQQWLMDQVK